MKITKSRLCALCKVGLHHGRRPLKKPYNQANLLVKSKSFGPMDKGIANLDFKGRPAQEIELYPRHIFFKKN